MSSQKAPVSNTRINWYKSPLPKETLKQLTQRSDAKGLAHAGAFLLIYLATTGLSVYFFLTEVWVPMIVTAYLHAVFVGFLGLGAAVHELSHGTAFKTRWLNSFFFRLFAFLTWNSYFHFKESHRRHHQYTAFDGLDREVIGGPIQLTPGRILAYLTFDAKGLAHQMYVNFQHALGNTDVDHFFWCPLIPKEDIRTKTLIRWARTLFIGHGILLAIFVATRMWILIFTVTFAAYFARFLIVAAGIQQHSGLTRNIPDWRVIAYTAKFGPIMSFLYWNMNYHVEHHMYAAVPFYNLPKLHAALKPDLPIQLNGFWKGVRHVFWVQKMQQQDPDFRYMPEFPPTANPPRMAN